MGMLLEGNKIVQFNAYQPWFLPAALGFNHLKTKFHLEAVDKAEGKINININNKSYLEVTPIVANEVEVVLTGVPPFRVALLAKELRITTIMKDLPEITTAVTLKTFSLFQNTLGIEVMVGKISHKTLLGWN